MKDCDNPAAAAAWMLLALALTLAFFAGCLVGAVLALSSELRVEWKEA